MLLITLTLPVFPLFLGGLFIASAGSSAGSRLARPERDLAVVRVPLLMC